MDTIYLLYTCNLWKEHISKRVVFATMDKESLYAAAANNIFETDMEYEGLTSHDGLLRFKKDYEDNCVDFGKLTYGFVEEFENDNVREAAGENDITQALSWLKMSDIELKSIMGIESDAEQNEAEEDLEI